MDFTRVKRVGIVGAGVSGLATARTLISQGLDCTVFDRNDVLGGVWSDGYPNFGLQVQSELYEFPDWPLPEGTPDFTPGPIIQKYLTDFADHFGITPRIRFNTEVTGISERGKRGNGWTISTRAKGRVKKENFDLVVICIGLYSNLPNMPAFPDQKKFKGEIIHISGLNSHDQIADKRVAVLGYGKSATDAALESATVAAQTHIIIREPHWPLPPKLAGILPFKWGMLNRLTSALIPLYQNPTPVERIVHGLGKPLAWFYWRLVEALLYFQCRLGSRFGTRVNLVPDKPIEIDAFGESTMLPRADFYPLVRRGTIDAHRTSIKAYTQTSLSLADGTMLDIDVMILATGWTADFSFLSKRVWRRLGKEDDGFYLYRHMVHPEVPSLFFVGRASTISSILTYSLQARWLGELLKGNFQLPSVKTMNRDIEEMKTWKRSWIPFSSARSARLIAHMQHYHDELVRDFGASPWRKTGAFAPLKELIAPYEPRDYASIVAGEKRGDAASKTANKVDYL